MSPAHLVVLIIVIFILNIILLFTYLKVSWKGTHPFLKVFRPNVLFTFLGLSGISVIGQELYPYPFLA